MRWIGGGSGAGKSTVAATLAAAYGMRLHRVEPFSKYLARADPDTHPFLHAFVEMDMDERWVTRDPATMAATFHGFTGEGFELVIEDVMALPDDPPILVEGFSILPTVIAPLVTSRAQAIWLLPTPGFRRAAFERRGSTWVIPNRTSDPERALENLLARDALFTERLRAETAELKLEAVDVDGRLDADGLAELVATRLQLLSLRARRR